MKRVSDERLDDIIRDGENAVTVAKRYWLPHATLLGWLNCALELRDYRKAVREYIAAMDEFNKRDAKTTWEEANATLNQAEATLRALKDR